MLILKKIYIFIGSLTMIAVLSSCLNSPGMYTPSFNGINSVYNKGQSIHSLSAGPSLGKYFNYSPMKNLAFFADARYNGYLPQASVAIGGYSSHYSVITKKNKAGMEEKTEVGFHFDSYLGFGYHGGNEFLGDSRNFPFSSFQYRRDEIVYHSFLTYWQTGVHFKVPGIKFDLAYRLNHLDIEKLVFSPTSDQNFHIVQYIAANNPYILNEIQFLIGFGSKNLRTHVGVNLMLSGKHKNYIRYSDFSTGHIGITYIFDKTK
jgi:hypothetical protein